jgi:dihydroorotase
MIGLETALPILVMTMINSGLLTWAQLADRMSVTPAQIGGYSSHGQKIAIGAQAHLTVINPTQTFTVDRDLVSSRSRNTPFHGMVLPGRIMATIFQGRVTYSAEGV